MTQQPNEPEKNKLISTTPTNLFYYMPIFTYTCDFCGINEEVKLEVRSCRTLCEAQSCDWPKILQIKLPTRAEVRKDTRH